MRKGCIWTAISKQPLRRMSGLGRKSPLGGHGWNSSPERRETATTGHPSVGGERLLFGFPNYGRIRHAKQRGRSLFFRTVPDQ